MHSKTTPRVAQYVQHLKTLYPRLQPIRINLGHTALSSLESLKLHIKHLLNNRRSNHTLFANLAGYILKYEHTPTHGHQAQALLFYDTSRPVDPFIADKLGSYWVNRVTQGAGTYSAPQTPYTHNQDVELGTPSSEQDTLDLALTDLLHKEPEQAGQIPISGRTLAKGIIRKPSQSPTSAQQSLP